ncbi:hypothetical protein PM082_016901 [Marasmius tenuissimus]|nr:hypothetical protein PM082_016901 [Marasmius tenuissimus]
MERLEQKVIENQSPVVDLSDGGSTNDNEEGNGDDDDDGGREQGTHVPVHAHLQIRPKRTSYSATTTVASRRKAVACWLPIGIDETPQNARNQLEFERSLTVASSWSNRVQQSQSHQTSLRDHSYGRAQNLAQ